ncbi:hypothetical protein OG21DRAFT_149888 [Imleria badia]|nr:hypothetical protein OG21DRAFT_149888 [Imleria badia]
MVYETFPGRLMAFDPRKYLCTAAVKLVNFSSFREANILLSGPLDQIYSMPTDQTVNFCDVHLRGVEDDQDGRDFIYGRVAVFTLFLGVCFILLRCLQLVISNGGCRGKFVISPRANEWSYDSSGPCDHLV